MALACSEREHSRANPAPAQIDRVFPGEVVRLEHNVADDVDCELQGLTISNSAWSIDPADADGNLTLSAPAISGLVTSTAMTVDPSLEKKNYLLLNTVDTSDGQTFRYYTLVPVRAIQRYDA